MPCRAMLVTIGKNLPEQTGLAGPAHSDHRRGFAFDAGQPGITPSQCRKRQGLRINDLLMNHWAYLSFHEGQYHVDLSLLNRELEGFLRAGGLQGLYSSAADGVASADSSPGQVWASRRQEQLESPCCWGFLTIK